MNRKTQREGIAILLALFPVFYLFFSWNNIPDVVPLQWNWKGETHDLTAKINLWLIPLFPIAAYLILRFTPTDAGTTIGKKRLEIIRLIFLLFLALLALTIIFLAKTGIPPSESLFLTFGGVAFSLIGYILRFIKPNYFIGIRTPWTLKNETVWKDTHESISVFWVIGGVAMTIVSLLFSFEVTLIVEIFLFVLLVSVPIIYSNVRYHELRRKKI